MHEIVTIQFGQNANYLASHFWNTHTEEISPINHDVNFRSGIAPDGSETYTPRTLIYDLKGAFGTLRRVNALYEETDGDEAQRSHRGGAWPGNTSIQRASPTPVHPYQDALAANLLLPTLSTSNVRFWSDYLNVFYHPRSIVQLSDYALNDRISPFLRWDNGTDLFNSLNQEHDILDRDLRLWLEECDSIQGVQIFTNPADAWGGFSSSYLEALRDELGKKSIWVWGCEDGMREGRDKEVVKSANYARSMLQLSSHGSLYIPMKGHLDYTPDYLNIDRTSIWHTSAVQVVAMESLTLPSRLRESRGRRGLFQDMEEFITEAGRRKISGVEYSLKTERGEGKHWGNTQHDVTSDGTESHNATESSSWDSKIDLFTQKSNPNSKTQKLKEHFFGSVQVSREEPDPKTTEAEERMSGSDFKTERFEIPLPFPQLDSFPRIFSLGGGNTNKLSVRAAVNSSTAIAQQVSRVSQTCRLSIGIEEREEVMDGLQNICEEYLEGWTSSDDEDDD